MTRAGPDIQSIFQQVLMTCDRMGLIGREMFAIDGVKLPSNASKRHSGKFDDLERQAKRLEKAVSQMIQTHQSRDAAGEDGDSAAAHAKRIDTMQREAARIRDFMARNKPRLLPSTRKEVMSNITDNESAKLATSKGVIQG